MGESSVSVGAKRRPWRREGIRAGLLEEVTSEQSVAGEAGKGIPGNGTASQQGRAPESSQFPAGGPHGKAGPLYFAYGSFPQTLSEHLLWAAYKKCDHELNQM